MTRIEVPPLTTCLFVKTIPGPTKKPVPAATSERFFCATSRPPSVRSSMTLRTENTSIVSTSIGPALALTRMADASNLPRPVAQKPTDLRFR
jgi:hypothetical protein